MDNINHLAAANENYKNCIYALASRDYNKALGWINSAIVHFNLHIVLNKSADLAKLNSKLQECEKLKVAIQKGVKCPAIEPTLEPLETKPAQEAESYKPKKKECITFDDVVGLNHVKETIMGAIVYPFKYEDIYRAFKRKSGGGILLYGAPGTGKTMIAKAIAGEIDAEFISVNCSDIYSKWLGESEKNIKKVFEQARKAKRAVIFFDEFETLGRARRADDAGTSEPNGVVGELLAQIDGFSTDSNSTILVIAATNRPWDIDSALLRSGRFERHLYVGVPDESARVEMFKKQMEGLPVDELCFDELAMRTDGFSSADVVEVCNRSKDKAIMRSIRENVISNIAQEDFVEVICNMHSTVNQAELKRLEAYI